MKLDNSAIGREERVILIYHFRKSGVSNRKIRERLLEIEAETMANVAALQHPDPHLRDAIKGNLPLTEEDYKEIYAATQNVVDPIIFDERRGISKMPKDSYGVSLLDYVRTKADHAEA